MKRIFKTYCVGLLTLSCGFAINTLFALLTGTKLYLNSNTLPWIIGSTLIAPVFLVIFNFLPEYIKKVKQMLDAKTQKDLEEYRKLRHISQGPKHSNQ